MTAKSDPLLTRRQSAAILSRALEIEHLGVSPADVSDAMTLSGLKAVALEAGINPKAIDLAASEMSLHGNVPGSSWLGPSVVQRATRLLDADLAPEAVHLLFRVLERQLNQPGNVSEAFGQIHWTSNRAQLTTEVALSRGEGDARIDVEQRYPSPMRPLLHVIPGALGAAAAAAIAAPVGVIGGGVIALAVGGGLVGSAIGRGVWHLAAREMRQTTRRIASDLAAAVSELDTNR